jgi:hypothetical protein
MPRRSDASGLQSQATKIVEVVSILHEHISSGGSLEALQQHWQVVDAFRVAAGACSNDLPAFREMVLRTRVVRQLFGCVAAALQQVATAGSSVGPEEPALATAAHLAVCMDMVLFKAYAVTECRPEIVGAIQQSGEGFGQACCCCNMACLCAVQRSW